MDSDVDAGAEGDDESDRMIMMLETGAQPPDDDADSAFARLVAESTGRSVEDVLAVQDMQKRWSPVITGVLTLSPGTLIGTRMPVLSQDPIELHLKGEVSQQVEAVIKKSGLAVIIRDGQPYSIDELIELKASMHDVLKGLGVDECCSTVGLPPDGARVYLTYPASKPTWILMKFAAFFPPAFPSPSWAYCR